jgi:hypothetical protein
MVRATWPSRGKSVSYANIFRIVPNAPFDVLFGRNLILSGDIPLSSENSEHGSVLGTAVPSPDNETVSSFFTPQNFSLISVKPEQKKQRLAREAEAKRTAQERHDKNPKVWEGKDVKTSSSSKTTLSSKS